MGKNKSAVAMLKKDEVAEGWLPPNSKKDKRESIQFSTKIRIIGTAQDQNYNPIAKLSNTGLGRVYKNHLKQYTSVRWLVLWLWRNGLPVYRNILACFSEKRIKKWRPLIKLHDFLDKNEIPMYTLVEDEIVKTQKPKVFPVSEQGYLTSPHNQYRFPKIYISLLYSAVIHGGTNLMLVNGEVVCHDLYDFAHDYTAEEHYGSALVNVKSKHVRWLLHDKEPKSITLAATFVDACASNYAHWITEVLPRIALFCAEERFKNVPIVVDEGLHQNIMESLLLVVGSEREIIMLSVGSALIVDELYVVSATGYVPYGRRTSKPSGHSHGLFSPSAFEILCSNLRALRQEVDSEIWPEKIFIRRNSDVRKITNAAEIEKLLIEYGYVMIEPEKLTFSEQVRLFSNAKSIIASSGAALANILFSHENTKIFILIGKCVDTSYWYWQNIACSSGKTIQYVMGELAGGYSMGIHADFKVDFEYILQALGEDS